MCTQCALNTGTVTNTSNGINGIETNQICDKQPLRLPTLDQRVDRATHPGCYL